jgi:hypothetical protein
MELRMSQANQQPAQFAQKQQQIFCPIWDRKSGYSKCRQLSRSQAFIHSLKQLHDRSGQT